MPRIRWDAGLSQRWQPGEARASKQLRRFCERNLASYAAERDRPDHLGTSSLSPHGGGFAAHQKSAPALVAGCTLVFGGRDYPQPVVNLTDSREAALAAYARLKA